MDNRTIEIAAKAMKTTIEEASKHNKPIHEINAFYFWNKMRGGISVIVSENGEKLAASSAVSFQKHLDAFIAGKRN